MELSEKEGVLFRQKWRSQKVLQVSAAPLATGVFPILVLFFLFFFLHLHPGVHCAHVIHHLGHV
ncbi:MAG: hypothetical protein ACE5H0_10985, partial [Bacteroidota bacterium]